MRWWICPKLGEARENTGSRMHVPSDAHLCQVWLAIGLAFWWQRISLQMWLQSELRVGPQVQHPDPPEPER
jgi:hypothetical protein